uniref:Chromosome partition protein Smc n=1 Tax=Loigolactobacillus rennini TaxID=238013 RepID=A0A1K2I6Z9_9LACO|nr:Chromosome partition protein smc [Loigolactobacillus rennini]
MQLKTLEISGFKSFADKTTIQFDHGITGIVGPNGSGKSNITEAIRWALGEQSAKNLRGGKMPDIIFAGSNARKPLNRAEVSLTFDNQDHQLKSDYDEVNVSRVLYRDGTSTFYLNQKSCRLRDIVNLFMDSGLGRESFSIISQGKIAAIFNSKPAQRRGIIEEAAGVVKYKQRKKEADNQLTETAANLNRVSDIISELAQQVEPLKKQSSLAKDYLRQKKQLDQVSKTLLVRQIEAQAAKRDQQQQTLTQTQENVQLAQHNQTEFQTQVNAQKKQQQKVAQQLDRLQQQQLQITKHQGELSSQTELVGERRRVAQENLANLKTGLTQQNDKLQKQHQSLVDEKKALAQAAKQLHQQELQIKQAKAHQKLDKATLEKAIEKLRQRYIDQLQQQTSLHNEAVYLKRQQQQDQVQNQKQQAQQQALLQRVQTLKQQQEKAAAQVTQLTKKQQQLQQQRQQLQSQSQTEQAHYQQQQQQWYQALAIMQKAQAKQASLAEMQEDYSGFYAGVRGILKHKKQITGIIGAVAELIDVPQKYNQAIESALGNQLQSVVVKDEAAGKNGINYLRHHHLGRATFLPAAVMQPQPLNQFQQQQLTGITGYIGLAADLVTFSSAYANVIRYLLGRIVVATDLDAAIKIATALRHRVRIVTLKGDLLNPGGAMTGGGHNQRGGLLARKQEQQTLTAQIAQMQQQLTAKEQALQTKKAQLEAAAKQNVTLEQKLKALAPQLLEQQGIVKDVQRQQAQLTQQQKAIAFTDQQQNETKISNQEKLTTNQQQTQQVTAAIQQLKTELAEKQTHLSNWQADQTASAEKQQQLKTALAVAQERQKQRQQAYREHVEQQSALQAEITRDQRQAKQLQQQLDAQKQNHRANQDELKISAQKLAQLSQQIKTLKLQRAQIDSTLQQQEQQLAHAQATYQKQATNAQQLKTSLNYLNQQLKQALTQLESDYQLSFEAAKADTLTTDFSQLKQQEKLLKLGLADLGEVNLGAIAEYQRVSQRYDFLLEQRKDLLTAREQLTATMTEMDQEVGQRFKATFEATAKAFAEIFPLMFGGGQANLSLTDPTDLLTTGIEITAQPPGKKLQQLSLLSGGEQALTAITLLFAIINVRPVPLCILDEVEAALDEANVARFGRFLKRYDQQTQFIVITHRKGTMMAMDVLFGVAMQESGVSKMVSVALEDAQREASA